MKNKMLKLMCGLSVMLFSLMGKVSFADDGDITIDKLGSGTATGEIVGKIKNIISPVAAILVFASVIMVGFEIIMKRNDADKRMESMSSLLWVAIGAGILGMAGLLFSFVTGTFSAE